MSELTLNNFPDMLDPDILDSARKYWEAGKLKNIKQSLEGRWKASFSDKNESGEVGVELRRNEVIKIECVCSAFRPGSWEEDPCLHAVALLFSLKNNGKEHPSSLKKSATEKSKKALEKKPSKRKKSPEEDILEGLEMPQLQAFIREMIEKNKEFKSQFMLYFSGSGEQQEAHYDTLIRQAISAVKGRKKYLPPGDAGKIATALTPLYKKAAEAEAKAFFNEALSIIDPLLTQLNEINPHIQGESSRFNKILENTFGLRSQIVQNDSAPFTLKETLFERFLEEYKRRTSGSGTKIYDNLLSAARVVKRIDVVVNVLEKEIEKADHSSYYSGWGEPLRLKLIRRLIDIYETDLKTPERVDDLLKNNLDLIPVLMVALERAFKKKAPDQILHYISHYKNNEKIYRKQSYFNYQYKDSLAAFEMAAYEFQGDKQKAGKLALELFQGKFFNDIELFKLAKKNLGKEAIWENEVNRILKNLKNNAIGRIGGKSLYYRILAADGRLEQFLEHLGEEKSLKPILWMEEGMLLLELSPSDYWPLFKRETGKILEEANDLPYNHMIASSMMRMAEVPELRTPLREFIQEILSRGVKLRDNIKLAWKNLSTEK